MNALDPLVARGVLSPLDRQLAATLAELDADAAVEAAWAAAFASRALADGDTCVDLADLVSRPPEDPLGEVVDGWSWPDLQAWRAALAAARFAGTPGERVPVIVDGDRVWLHRYREHERQAAEQLARVAATPVPPVDDTALAQSIARLFPEGWRNPEQEAAVAASAGQALTVLAGGPGTGKTTTVVRLVAALVEQALAQGERAPTVRLLAPTGKAAARLAESVVGALDDLVLDPATDEAVRDAIPRTAQTIHRALGRANAWLTRFRHDARRPWPDDLVIVDEVSMVDLPLMVRLLDAVKPGARVVLVGDPRQLAAVGVGAVLADLCAPDAAPWVADRVTRLIHSRRFRPDGGIGRLAAALDAGDASGAAAALADEAELEHLDVGDPAHAPALDAALVAGWTPLCEAATGPDALAALDGFRVLCALREGPTGVAGLNARCEALLSRAGKLQPQGAWYAGRPILVTANDPDVGLFNGDTGVLVPDAEGRLRAWFHGPEGPMSLAPSRLPAHETAFAMTVHKSQGSEMREVLLVLPQRPVRVLTRELLYTAVTRAKERAVVAGRLDVLAEGLARPTARTTGLGDALRAAEGVS